VQIRLDLPMTIHHNLRYNSYSVTHLIQNSKDVMGRRCATSRMYSVDS
jgi:hypothetical protein